MFPFSTSYYEGTTDLLIHRQQGCLARSRRQQGIVVLNYGSPRNLGTDTNPIYGAGLKREPGAEVASPVNLDQIQAAVQAFADGYYMSQSCSDSQINIPITDPAPANLVIAVGTTNSYLGTAAHPTLNPALTREHGAAWAEMVKRINSYLDLSGYADVTAAGAYDAEPGWWDAVGNSTPTFEWARGYNSVPGRASYYDFGSIDGGIRDSSWLFQSANQRFDDVFELAWGIDAARPLPQIYNAAYAKEWHNLRWYGLVQKRRNMNIDGVMTEAGSSGRNMNDPSEWQDVPLDLLNRRAGTNRTRDFTPHQGWQAMYDALHRTLVGPLSLTSDFILPNSFLVAPQTVITVADEPGCHTAMTYTGQDPDLNHLPAGTCLPANTVFPIDSTFPSKLVLSPELTPLFNRVTPQPLPWATDIAFGRWQ